jgi:N-methylhydantoinase B
MKGLSVDPVTVEVVKGALIYTAEEMGIALRKSAYSPNIKERMDHSCAIFDAEKRMIAQAEHIPVHLGSMAYAVRKGLEHYGRRLEEGDMLLFNDPYISGTHLPDITLIAPTYYEGKLVAYLANKAHHSDVGGKAPGSLAGDATELFQEGVIIPPVRFVKSGEIDEELSELILSNVRTPKVRMGDLRAQIAANTLGIRRILDMVEEHGVERLHAAIEEIMDYSEKRMRREIDRMPEGTYDAEDLLEDTGVGEDPVKIKVRITIERNEIIFDYTGTDSQVEGPINAPLGVTLSGVYFTLISMTDPTIPINDGCYRPVKMMVPEGCLLNPVKPAPVAGGNVETSQRNADVLLKAFAQIVPERVCAAGQGTMNNVSVGGIDPKTGRLWAFYETIAGGYGGRQGIDGVDGVHVHMTNTMNTPIEAIELAYPIRFLTYQLRCDTGGPGKWRGGCGLERGWMLLAPSATLSILAERNKIQPWGLFGGKPGALGEYLLKKPNGTVVKLKSKCTVKMNEGDILIIRTPGGGGYGDPHERDPSLVLQDVVNDLVSLESARRDYGVVLDGDQMAVDLEATERLRKREEVRAISLSRAAENLER